MNNDPESVIAANCVFINKKKTDICISPLSCHTDGRCFLYPNRAVPSTIFKIENNTGKTSDSLSEDQE